MDCVYEKQMLAKYFINAFNNARGKADYKKLIEWYMFCGDDIFSKVNLPTEYRNYIDGIDVSKKYIDPKKVLLKIVEELQLKLLSRKSTKISIIEKNIGYVQEVLGLKDLEKDFFGIIARKDYYEEYHNFFEMTNLDEKINFGLEWSRKFLNKKVKEIESQRIAFRLYNLGLFEMKPFGLELSIFAKDLVMDTYKDITSFRNKIVGRKLKSNLNWNDYHYVNNADKIAALIKGSLTAKAKGINVLLYGPAGVGKTEFARVLAKYLNVDIYAVAENSKAYTYCRQNRFSNTDDEDFRFSKLSFILNMLKSQNNTILLLDEAEDLLFSNKLKKIEINTLLENNNIPIIWTSNDAQFANRAFLRRFSLSSKFDELNDEIKERVYASALKKNSGLKFKDEDIKRITRKYSMPVAYIASAARNAKLSGQGIDIIENSLDAMNELCFHNNISSSESLNTIFDPKLLNTDKDLEALADKIKSKNIKKFSLCLYGISGTGKSAYAIYLAKKLGIKYIHKHCSDILSKYVGDSEKNIREAFEEAKIKKAMLIFDEVDAFLIDRSYASKSWELSGVNEMLTQMEKYEYPFVCTTNLLNKIDKAALRRFDIKVKYDYLTNEQKTRAYKDFFYEDGVDLSSIEHLTPSDFNLVKRNADLWDIKDKSEIIKLLCEEQEAREPQKNKMGF